MFLVLFLVSIATNGIFAREIPNLKREISQQKIDLCKQNEDSFFFMDSSIYKECAALKPKKEKRELDSPEKQYQKFLSGIREILRLKPEEKNSEDETEKLKSPEKKTDSKKSPEEKMDSETEKLKSPEEKIKSPETEEKMGSETEKKSSEENESPEKKLEEEKSTIQKEPEKLDSEKEKNNLNSKSIESKIDPR